MKDCKRIVTEFFPDRKNPGVQVLHFRIDPRDLTWIERLLCRLGVYNRWCAPALSYSRYRGVIEPEDVMSATGRILPASTVERLLFEPIKVNADSVMRADRYYKERFKDVRDLMDYYKDEYYDFRQAYDETVAMINDSPTSN